MKIKKIVFCNINSLAGEWTIDFESPDFAKSGMFCISGPTGSGKTSILDAICLGLYGKTPRMGAIVGDSNEVMTYGAMSCSAQVFFECRGCLYSSCWEQHRAARTRRLQKYSWVLVNETTQTTEASFSKQSEIETTMTRVIGLDFGQFTKSMMLAQGEFNKFLKCNENERAAILEKLTGDEIYRKIAVSVHALYMRANKAVEDIENKMGAVTLFSEEDLAKLKVQIENAIAQKEMWTNKEERFRNISAWYENLHSIELHLQSAKSQLEKAERERENFEPHREKLECALRAQEIESLFTEFNSVRENIVRMRTTLAEKKAKLPSVESNLKEAEMDNREKQSTFEKYKKDYAENEAVWERVSSMDADIRNSKSQLKNSEDNLAKVGVEIETIQNKIKSVACRIAENEQSLKKVADYIEKNHKDESIDVKLSLLKSQVAEWKTEKANVSDDLKKLDTARKMLQDFDTAFDLQNQELCALQNYLAEHFADAELVNVLPEMNSYASDADKHNTESLRLSSEIESKQKQVENVEVDREQKQKRLAILQGEKEAIIQDDIPVVVSELRRSLKTGEPCPVCGSREHVACLNSAEIESGAEKLNDVADKLRKINNEMESTQRLLDSLENQQRNIKDVLCEDVRKLKEETDAKNTALKLLNEKLKPWNIAVSYESYRNELKNLVELKTQYLQKKESAECLQNKVNHAAITRAKLTGDVNVAEESLKKTETKSQELSQKIEESFATWFSNVRMEDVDALLCELEKKNVLWKKALDKKTLVEKYLETDQSNKVQLQENLSLAQLRRNEAEFNHKESQENLSAHEQNRKEVFGEKSVENERLHARTLRDTAEKLAEKARQEEQQIRNAKMEIDHSIDELNNCIAETEPKFAQSQTAFLDNLASKKFLNEQEFLAARLSESERKTFQQLQKSVDDNLTAARTSILNFSTQLEEHQKKRDFEESEETAKQNLDTAKSKLNECTVNLAAWTEQKKNDEQLRQKFNDMQAEYSKLKVKRSDWEQMQRWFNGSRLDTGNGDVFVRFIQTITLRHLLKIANDYLRNMFPRYEMVTKPNSLNILLVDHDNSDAIRPIDNISGGEGFLVSLSLALGISTLASRNVRIDSMFLDEGFGTLDSKMLQETVVVLQKMQQEKGKLLGVITHVELVKNELSTHIEVTPCGGRSILSGAGVQSSKK